MSHRAIADLHVKPGTHARYRRVGACGFLLFLLLTHCGDGSDPGGPRITAFTYVNQFPADPYTAVFAFSFDAPNGISNGTASFFVNGKEEPQVQLKMADLMSAAGLTKADTRGDLAAALRFQNRVSSDTVDMILQIVDDSQKKSNRARVTLRFQYDN